jgi:L-threonylcarbamoyladenylate synthase
MEVLKATQKDLTSQVAAFLKKGKVTILPTDTVYGLVCDAQNEKAVEQIFKIKNRSENNPLPLFVRDIPMAKEIAQIKKSKEAVLKAFWPGRVTFVFDKKPGKLPNTLSAGKKTIGIRVPDYPLITDLLRKVDFPLAQTSANISGEGATTDIDDVITQFRRGKEKPDLIVDANSLPKTTPSAVVDLTGEIPRILRAGFGVKIEMFQKS